MAMTETIETPYTRSPNWGQVVTITTFISAGLNFAFGVTLWLTSSGQGRLSHSILIFGITLMIISVVVAAIDSTFLKFRTKEWANDAFVPFSASALFGFVIVWGFLAAILNSIGYF